MSLLDDVSIVVTPNGYKAGELYAVIPVPTEGAEEGTNMDFSSGTSPWALNSNWSLGGVGVIADGTSNSTVWQNSVVEDNKQYIVTYTLTDFLQGTVNVELAGSHGISRTIAGTYTEVITSGTSPTTRITFEGSGNFQVTLSNVIVKEWTGADMDVTRATDATRVDENGLIEDVLANVPRIDYTGGGCPHILAEPMRTNLATYSESFGSGKYFSIYGEANEVSSNNTSPSGTENATQIISTGQGKLYAFISLPANTTYSLSFYAKNVDATEVQSRILASGGSGGSNMTAVSYISQLSTTEWTKITHIFTTNSTAVQYYVFISNALNIGGNIQIWGAQLEEGSYATSYIPNFGTALGVTRNQDIFTRDGIGSLINSTEGVLFVEMAALSDDGVAKYLTMNDGSSNNDVRIYFNTASNGISALLKSTTGATQAFLSYTVTDTTAFHKIAFVYAVNRFELWVDGEKRAEDLSGIAPVGLTTLEFSRASNFLPFFGKVKQLQVYNTALSPTQLDALTS